MENTVLLKPNESKIILDYITNLEQENEILNRDIEAMKHNYNLLVRLIENGESMTQKFENGLTQKDYKSRIDKAIEYINKISTEPNVFGHYAIDGNCKKYLLNILTGGDEE
jgi:hypothetical protein